MAAEFTTDNFEDEVLKSDVAVLVDFWAEWCGPCKLIGPLIDKIADKTAGKFKVGKVNIDFHQDLAQQYNVSSIPTLMVFKNGEVVDTFLGANVSESQLVGALERA